MASGRGGSGRRIALAIGLATALVGVIAALIPRGYIANDDIGLIDYLRADALTPWISPILSRGLGFAYQQAPDLPWWGLYQYGLLVASGAVLFHTCGELIERRPGLARKATWLGAVVIVCSHAIVVIGITWTTVSIASLGAALGAFVAHALLCQVSGQPMSRLRSVIYGLVFVGGYMLRPQGLFAIVVTLLPLLVWTAWRFWKKRYLPRLGALIAMVAPFALVFAFQNRVPGARDEDPRQFDRFNEGRGQIHGQAAYEYLDKRAPELLARAGWTLEEYRDFANWLIVDEADYPPDKLERLLATGGVPEAITAGWCYRQLRGVVDDSAASVFLFLTTIAAGVVLALLGVIERWRGLGFCLGYLAYLIAVPLYLAAHLRFPQRLSLAMYPVAALGVFLYLVCELADRRDRPSTPQTKARQWSAVAVVGVFLLGWAWHFVGWLHQDPPRDRDALQALEDRVTARGGFVFVYVQSGLVDLDPLRPKPRGYDGLQGGWGTFSTIWYDRIQRLGVHRGADVLHAMIDNPEAYLLAPLGARGGLEEWIRRKARNPSVRLSIVDAADMLGGGRPELYRLVTTPLVPGSDEWQMMVRDQWAMAEALPGAPSVSGVPFRPVAFAPPYAQQVSPVSYPVSGIHLEPVEHGVRCTVTGDAQDGCGAPGEEGPYGGVHVPINGLRAARFEVTLIAPENIVSFNVFGQSGTSRSVRWRWQLDPQAQRFGYTGAFTMVPGYRARLLDLAVDTARPGELRDLHIFITVKPGTHAGFELRNVEVAER